MLNNTVNGNKIGKGAGYKNNTVINCIPAKTEIKSKEIGNIAQNILAELEEEWKLEATGKLQKSVLENLKEDYLSYKAGDNVVYVENGKIVKRENIDKNISSKAHLKEESIRD